MVCLITILYNAFYCPSSKGLYVCWLLSEQITLYPASIRGRMLSFAFVWQKGDK